MEHMEKRAFLAILISLAVLLLWQTVFFKKPPPQTSQPVQKEELKAIPSQGMPSNEEEKVVLERKTNEKDKKDEKVFEDEEKEAIIETNFYKAVFSSYGGALKSLEIKKYKNKIGKEGTPINLITQKDPLFYPFFLRFSHPELEGFQSLEYEIEQPSPLELVIVHKERKIKIERTYRFYPDDYHFDHSTKIWLKEKDFKGDVFIGISEVLGDIPKGNILTAPYADTKNFIFHYPEKTTRKKIVDLKEIQEVKTVALWAGTESRYFLSALLNESQVKPYLLMTPEQGTGGSIELQYPFYKEKDKDFFEIKVTAYFGPKKVDLLKPLGKDLEEAVDFGMFSILCIPLLWTMNQFYKVIPNYGIAIILLTLLVRIIFHPLTKKSYVSMREMQRIQPQMAKIKEKFKDDKQQMNKEVMALMKANKVNPLGGCLPLVVQMPIFFALYRVLYNAIELYQTPFFGWIKDLSAKDPYYITPILMGGAMFLQQKMTPATTTDPAQQKVMAFMPVIFSFFMIALPSGLVVYILFSTLLQLASQYLVNRDLIKKGL